jgi:hypothetical protein
MAATRYGFGNAVNNNNSRPLRKSSTSHTIISSRVRDIILDDSHPKFKQYGEWNGIGTIFVETAKNPILSETSNLIPAFPLFPNIKHYPLLNELVPILYLSNNNITDDASAKSAYYLPPINLWNSQIHNAIPSTDVLPESQQKDYQQTELGSVRRVTDQSTEINLGKTFNESNVIDIHPLLPYEGDIIYEGRFGNSIRLGSTVNNSFIPNPWSTTGANGSPIFILRNGQKPINDNSWVPTLEDINEDTSSIYLTSTQKLPIFPASDIQDSFAKSTLPESVSQYSKSQIVLNSDRLVFNAKNDSIILGAKQSTHLTAGDTVGIDGGKQITLAAPKVYLGSSQGVEGTQIQSVVLGDNLNLLLGDIAIFLGTLSIAFAGATDPAIRSISANAFTLSESILNEVNGRNLLSKKVKTA